MGLSYLFLGLDLSFLLLAHCLRVYHLSAGFVDETPQFIRTKLVPKPLLSSLSPSLGLLHLLLQSGLLVNLLLLHLESQELLVDYFLEVASEVLSLLEIQILLHRYHLLDEHTPHLLLKIEPVRRFKSEQDLVNARSKPLDDPEFGGVPVSGVSTGQTGWLHL